MNVAYCTGALRIETASVGLGELHPVINGDVDDQAVWHEVRPGRYECALPSHLTGTFSVETNQDNLHYLVYGISGLPDDFVLDSFGIAFTGLTNIRAFLRMGYFSWDGASYIEPETAPPGTITGYALTQLLPRFGEGQSCHRLLSS